MPRRYSRLTVIVGVAAVLGGCATAGNEVLVFGTDTKVGISIAGDPTGAPDFTLGYRRREAVWLPVSVGGGGVPSHLCTGIAPALKCDPAEPTRGSHVCVPADGEGNATAGDRKLRCEELGTVKRQLYVGSSTPDKDAYSVIANFGLQTGGGGGTQIAQYIATGMAARLLAAKGGEKLVRGGDVASAARAEVLAEADKMRTVQDKMVDEILKDRVDTATGKVDATKWSALLARATPSLADNAALKGLGNKDATEVRRSLKEENNAHLGALHKAASGG